MSGPTPSPTARRPTTGCRSSAARPGSGTRRRLQYYLHNFLASQPDLNFHNPEVQDALLDVDALLAGARRRRLPPRHHQLLLPHRRGWRTIRRCRRRSATTQTAPAVNPYNFQEHLYDKSQPGEPRLPRAPPRAARRVSGARRGRRGRRQPARARSRWPHYTSGDDRLHMCYTFDFLAPDVQRRARPQGASTTSSSGAPDGWICWPSPTTTWCATSRAGRRAARPGRLHQGSLSALLLSLRGSVCLYQGEELGPDRGRARLRGSARSLRHRVLARVQGPRRLPHADGLGGDDAEWRLLDRPSPGCRCRPSICRAPSTASRAIRASLLEHYRRFLAFRRANPALAKGDIDFLAADGDVRRLHARATATSSSSAPSTSAAAPPASISAEGDAASPWTDTALPRRRADGTIKLGSYGAWFGRIG